MDAAPSGGEPVTGDQTAVRLEITPRVCTMCAQGGIAPHNFIALTHDPLIKSQMLYRLSYGLSPWRPYGCATAEVNIKDRESPAFGLRQA